MSLDKSPGKRHRVEVVTARLKPDLKYLAEIAARSQRRSLSSFLEWCVEDSLKGMRIDRPEALQERLNARMFGIGADLEDIERPFDGPPPDAIHPSIWDSRSDLWDESESNRFLKLAGQHAYLLSAEERAYSTVIFKTKHYRALWNPPVAEDAAFVQANWQLIKNIATAAEHIPADWPLRFDDATFTTERGNS